MKTSLMDEVVETWTNVLMGFVPAGELNRCLYHALRAQGSNAFPPGAADVYAAWTDISMAESGAQRATAKRKCEFCRFVELNPAFRTTCPVHGSNILTRGDQ